MFGFQQVRMSKRRSSRSTSAKGFRRDNQSTIATSMAADQSETSTATLMWQCACTISSAQTVLQRANGNSMMYYTLTHINPTRSPSQKRKSVLTTNEDTLVDLTITEDPRPDEESAFELEESTNLQMDDFYPAYPAHFY